MTLTVETQAVSTITRDDVRTWLLDHGLDYRNVTEVSIRITSADDVAAWLDATWYKRDVNGSLYVDLSKADGSAATGQTSVPLRYFPLLTPG